MISTDHRRKKRGFNTSNSRPVEALKDGEVVKYFPSQSEAQRQGFCQSGISACITGDAKHHRGYQWRSAKRKED